MALRPAWDPDVDKVKDWVAKVGSNPERPIILVEGPTPAHRASVYRLTRTVQEASSELWLEQGIVVNLTDRFAKERAIGSIIPHQWDILWNLLTLDSLEVEDQMHLLVDQGGIFTEAFRAIWEARFRLDEGRELKNFVDLLSRWMTSSPLSSEERQLLGELGVKSEIETTYERLDLLFFLVTLAHQNELIGTRIVVLDGIDRLLMMGVAKRKAALKELLDFCIVAERWARLGSPLGFILGYSNEHDALESFERSNAKLGAKLRRYVV